MNHYAGMLNLVCECLSRDLSISLRKDSISSSSLQKNRPINFPSFVGFHIFIERTRRIDQERLHTQRARSRYTSPKEPIGNRDAPSHCARREHTNVACPDSTTTRRSSLPRRPLPHHSRPTHSRVDHRQTRELIVAAVAPSAFASATLALPRPQHRRP